MGKMEIKEDQEIELTYVDDDLEVYDGAIITVPEGTKELVVNGDFNSRGDIVVKGNLSCKNIKHENGYLEIEGNVKTSV
ncbi:MAG: hypothetical protein ACTSSF_09910, partial [Candidatus Heimdallarchaeaceae archaeon]